MEQHPGSRAALPAGGASEPQRSGAGVDDTQRVHAGMLLLACVPLTAALARVGEVRPAPTLQVLLALLGVGIATAALLLHPPALRGGWQRVARAGSLVALLLLGAASLASAIARLALTDPATARPVWVVVLGVPVLVAVTGLVVLAVRGRGRLALAALVLLALSHLGPVLRMQSRIDVLLFQRDGASALMRGTNPYTLTFTNPYDAELSRLFYGPDIVDGDRLLFGFPYPPASLLMVLPGHLLGDVRYASVGALTLASVLLWWHARDRFGRCCAVLLALLPGMSEIILNSWTEPLLLALLVLVVLGAERGWRTTPMLLGLFLVMKQYLVVVLPALWLLRPVAARSRWGERGFAARTLATAALVTLPLALWAPLAFWDSVVGLQFRQPFRADSTSLLVWLVNHTGWPPPSVYGWLPLAGGLLTSVLVARRAARTPAGFAAGVGLVLLVTIMLSKQAFANYYLLAVGALVVAAATWPRSETVGSAP